MKDELISTSLSWNGNKTSLLQTTTHMVKARRSVLSFSLPTLWPAGPRSAPRSSGAGERRAGSRTQQDPVKRFSLGKQVKNLKDKGTQTSTFLLHCEKTNYLLRLLRGKWELAGRQRQTGMLMGSFGYLGTQNFKTASQSISITVLVKPQYIK